MAGIFHVLYYPIGARDLRSNLMFPAMAPGDRRTYVLELSAFCDSAQSTIASVAPTVDGTLQLAIAPIATGARTLTLTVAGGDLSVPDPSIYLPVTLASGDVEKITITQFVEALVPSAPLGSGTGAPLTVAFHPVDVSTLVPLAGGAQPGDTVVALRDGVPGLVSAISGGSSGLVSLTAGAALSGHRVLMPTAAGRVIHADPTGPGYQFAGISAQAVAIGDQVLVGQAGALIVEPSWSWTPGAALFVGPAGVLTAVPPTTGVLQQVAVATAPMTILVQPYTPILRLPT